MRAPPYLRLSSALPPLARAEHGGWREGAGHGSEGAAGAAGLLVFEFFLGGEVGGVVLGVVLIEAAEVLELLHAEGFFHHGNAGGEVVEHVAFPEAEDGPAHGGEALGVATVAEDVALYLGIPVGTVALDALLGMVPVAAMPEVAIDEDGDLAALEAR